MDEESYEQLSEFIPDDRFNPELMLINTQENSDRKKSLVKAMIALTAREKNIIIDRYLTAPTIVIRKDLGLKYKVAPSRIREIELKAIRKIKTRIYSSGWR